MAENDHPNPSMLWRHRRRHSYTALIVAVAETALLLLLEWLRSGTVEKLGAVIEASYMLWGVVILAYIANCAIEAYIDRRPK